MNFFLKNYASGLGVATGWLTMAVVGCLLYYVFTGKNVIEQAFVIVGRCMGASL